MKFRSDLKWNLIKHNSMIKYNSIKTPYYQIKQQRSPKNFSSFARAFFQTPFSSTPFLIKALSHQRPFSSTPFLKKTHLILANFLENMSFGFGASHGMFEKPLITLDLVNSNCMTVILRVSKAA